MNVEDGIDRQTSQRKRRKISACLLIGWHPLLKLGASYKRYFSFTPGKHWHDDECRYRDSDPKVTRLRMDTTNETPLR